MPHSIPNRLRACAVVMLLKAGLAAGVTLSAWPLH